MSFAKIIKEAKLELRCSSIQLAEQLGEPVENILAWEDGVEIPRNPKMVMLAILTLQTLWHVRTEPVYRHLEEYRKQLDEIRASLDQMRKERIERETQRSKDATRAKKYRKYPLDKKVVD